MSKVTRYMPFIQSLKELSCVSCVPWVGTLHKSGYGTVWFKNKNWYAHRLSWFINYGEIEEGLCILHRCDNPKCVNLAHLFKGTHKQNMEDKVQKGRQQCGKSYNHLKGSDHPNSKLSPDQRSAIKEEEGSFTDIGNRYHVSRRTVYRIKNDLV